MSSRPNAPAPNPSSLQDGAKADAAPTREDSLAAAAAAFAIDVPPPTLDAAEVEAGLRRAALERSAERKVLLHLLPTLFLFSLLNYIDRCAAGLAHSSPVLATTQPSHHGAAMHALPPGAHLALLSAMSCPSAHAPGLPCLTRSNLAFASVELERDLGINNAVFGLASGVFFVTYCLGDRRHAGGWEGPTHVRARVCPYPAVWLRPPVLHG